MGGSPKLVDFQDFNLLTNRGRSFRGFLNTIALDCLRYVEFAVALLVRPEVPTITRGGWAAYGPPPLCRIPDGGEHSCDTVHVGCSCISTEGGRGRSVRTDSGGGGAHTRGKAEPAIR